MQIIYNLLKDATFSAKNYDSMSYNYDAFANQLIKDLNNSHTTLTLGKSNVYRALSGSLKSLGFNDRKTINKAVFAGLNVINNPSHADYDNVSWHFFHLRYLYELTGAGIVGKNGKSQRVKYLIYNDPSGNIYVKSTSDLVSQIIDNKMMKNTKTITIAKDIFK